MQIYSLLFQSYYTTVVTGPKFVPEHYCSVTWSLYTVLSRESGLVLSSVCVSWSKLIEKVRKSKKHQIQNSKFTWWFYQRITNLSWSRGYTWSYLFSKKLYKNTRDIHKISQMQHLRKICTLPMYRFAAIHDWIFCKEIRRKTEEMVLPNLYTSLKRS